VIKPQEPLKTTDLKFLCLVGGGKSGGSGGFTSYASSVSKRKMGKISYDETSRTFPGGRHGSVTRGMGKAAGDSMVLAGPDGVGRLHKTVRH